MILPQAQPTRRLWQQLRPARVVQADNLTAAAANGEGENVVNLSILTWRRRMEEEEQSVMEEEEVNAMEEEEDRGGDDVTAIAEAGIE